VKHAVLEEKQELFKRLVQEDLLSHAYLFFGALGGGKRTFARELAIFLEYGAFPKESGEAPALTDAYFLEPREGVIGIDEVRALRDTAYGRPLRSPRRLIVVERAELMTSEAQASALKLTEDAPPKACFIFIAPDGNALLPPLSSRLARVYFPANPSPEVPETTEETPLAERVEADIIKRFLENKRAQSTRIAWLLKKHAELSRYNLNERLQEKGIMYNGVERE